ncbi:DUF1501 domain-containing protein [Sphingomonas sp. SUN039]|uniref:DUF1501 domain-containing protein n=1 Tax=Sphingomonas sp. SUN039 TaxID=2937787 RepID=UPI0021645D43|nr:DUF1501 domain-containing protein [Sphingomonas sp. SUN039]UVO53933.1 DUF1501 domain-containing protein [Sphingomonas sp. SUN039]
MFEDQSRRAFLQRSSSLGIVGAASPFVMNLAAIGEAAASVNTDYKALVCIFLFGGNDWANTLPPYDQASYNAYQAQRSALAYLRTDLAPTLLNPTTALPGGRQFALSPSLAPLLPVFDAGKMAPVLNVGTLMQPTTKAQYTAKSVPLPPKLFSHNDQQSFWQASNPEGANSGWGGRIGDLMQAGNGNATLTCINASGNAVFLTGRQAVQYSVGTSGPIALSARTTLYGSTAASTALQNLMGGTNAGLLANEHAKVSKRSLDAYAQVSTALTAAPVLTTAFPTSSLGQQLKVVANMISMSSQLGARRQVFFVSTGGFDLHDNLVALHPGLLNGVATAARAFYDATVELGISDKVTAFTGSDFGRTLLANTDGSDHGWGSMHFVMGGAVKGKQLYGTAPEYGNNTPSDVGQGRLLPTTSVDQYASTLASWFGVANSDMTTVLPNMGNYNASTWNLGFV